MVVGQDIRGEGSRNRTAKARRTWLDESMIDTLPTTLPSCNFTAKGYNSLGTRNALSDCQHWEGRLYTNTHNNDCGHNGGGVDSESVTGT